VSPDEGSLALFSAYLLLVVSVYLASGEEAGGEEEEKEEERDATWVLHAIPLLLLHASARPTTLRSRQRRGG
jgi:hypothetical protein